ncbi:hypothetical protein EPUS_01116 [Endocarpon pusillum Z07020]|uniref:Uncharacterized protein n=1 Tax=Endocarpon pusillum (strain Z07020 / HMAS-L-300199) TaxID=1263415 RepID=U1HJR6_ENDPU|nr:uncharacterized protein EPUS_01116 [Endocarpon pusillum Z07020]ERF69159.1 hypothetical protein EPUS_01116 [Endocarpon pusillum Z07020]
MDVVRSIGTSLARLVSTQKILLKPFLLHAMVETPASLNFFLNPSGQLPNCTPQVHAVIRQYAVLLFSSVLVALSFAFKDLDESSGQAAGALALYHLAPVVRATGRLMDRQAVWQPLLFVTVHGVCLAGLLSCCWELYLKNHFAT